MRLSDSGSEHCLAIVILGDIRWTQPWPFLTPILLLVWRRRADPEGIGDTSDQLIALSLRSGFSGVGVGIWRIWRFVLGSRLRGARLLRSWGILPGTNRALPAPRSTRLWQRRDGLSVYLLETRSGGLFRRLLTGVLALGVRRTVTQDLGRFGCCRGLPIAGIGLRWGFAVLIVDLRLSDRLTS